MTVAASARAGVVLARGLVAWPWRAWCRLAPWQMILAGAVVLAAGYGRLMATLPIVPGNSAAYPLGWWGWFDQGRTIESIRALAAFDLAPDHHLYPLGYALLGAPFVRLFPDHPLLLVDLACLLAALAAFVAFAARLGLAARFAVPVFLLAGADGTVFLQWVVPWNTTPVAALLWGLLALVAAHAQDEGSPRRNLRVFAIGLLAAAVIAFRPTDAAVAGVCVIGGAFAARRRRGRDLAWLALGGLAALAPIAAIHLAIYGPHASPYMKVAGAIGFAPADLAWKAFVLLSDPRPWFGEGTGLLRRDPWVALAVAGLLPALATAGRRDPAGRLPVVLALALLAHAALYLSFVDLLPTGLWRYYNVHYWAWAMPGYGLLAALLLRDLAARRRPALASVPLAMLVLALRAAPVAAGEGAARMLTWPGAKADFTPAYFAHSALRDGSGRLANIPDMRVIAGEGGVRVLALRRDFSGPVAWVNHEALPDQVSIQAPLRWKEHWQLGWPCWLPPYACRARLPPP
jgi:hypothetical protein